MGNTAKITRLPIKTDLDLKLKKLLSHPLLNLNRYGRLSYYKKLTKETTNG